MTSAKENKRKLIISYLNMMYFSIATVLLAVVCALFFNNFYPLTNTWVLILESAGYVCWGTSLGALGAKFGSSNRETSTDILNQRLNFLISMLGIFVFSLAQALHPIIG